MKDASGGRGTARSYMLQMADYDITDSSFFKTSVSGRRDGVVMVEGKFGVPDFQPSVAG